MHRMVDVIADGRENLRNVMFHGGLMFRPAVNEILLLKMHLKRKCVIFNNVGVGAEGCLNIHFRLRLQHVPPL